MSTDPLRPSFNQGPSIIRHDNSDYFPDSDEGGQDDITRFQRPRDPSVEEYSLGLVPSVVRDITDTDTDIEEDNPLNPTEGTSFTAVVEVRKPIFWLKTKINSLVESNPFFFTKGWIDGIKNPVSLFFTPITIALDITVDLTKLALYVLANIALIFTLVGYSVKDSLQNKGLLEKQGIERLKEDIQKLNEMISPDEDMPSEEQITKGKEIIESYRSLKSQKGEETFVKLDTLCGEAVLLVLQASFLVKYAQEMRIALENESSSPSTIIGKLQGILAEYKEIFSSHGEMKSLWDFYKGPRVLGSSSPQIQKNIEACNGFFRQE